MILSSIGCQMRTARNVMNVGKSSTPSAAGTIAAFVVKYFATGAVTWKFLGRSWDIQVKKNEQKKIKINDKHYFLSETELI